MFGEVSTTVFVGMSAELALSPEFGVSVLFDYASRTAYDDAGTGTARSIFQFGSTLAWYPSEDFEGFRLGVEGTYLAGRAEGRPGSGANFATLLGYKPIARSRFTFLGDAGVGYRVSRPEERTTLGHGAYVLVRLGVGWSFL